MKTLIKLAVFAALCLPALAQNATWFRVAGEYDTVTSTTPVTYRYGTASGLTYAKVDCSLAPQCWIQRAATLKSFVVSYTTIGDSAPGLGKEFDILETATVQTVTVNGTTKTVPALAVTPQLTTTYLITCKATTTVPATGTMPTTLPISGSSCTAVKQ
jgi:hypothetical protein